MYNFFEGSAFGIIVFSFPPLFHFQAHSSGGCEKLSVCLYVIL